MLLIGTMRMQVLVAEKTSEVESPSGPDAIDALSSVRASVDEADRRQDLRAAQRYLFLQIGLRNQDGGAATQWERRDVQRPEKRT